MKERLELLKPLVEFNKDEYVFVQIFQRRKDNPELELSVKRLKSYSFYSWEELEEQLPRIQEICDLNNARAYIRLNKQNAVDVSLRCISEMSDNIRNGNPGKNKGVWDSVSGKNGSKDWWVLDLDDEHLRAISTDSNDMFVSLKEQLLFDLEKHFEEREKSLLDHVVDKMNKVISESKSGIWGEIDPIKVEAKYGNMFPIISNPTKTGVHIIVKPFDTRILEKHNKQLSSKGIVTIQIQKDANTILYIGNGR